MTRFLFALFVLAFPYPVSFALAWQDDRGPERTDSVFVESWNKVAIIYQEKLVPIHNEFERAYLEGDFEQLNNLQAALTAVKLSPERIDSDLHHWKHCLEAAQILDKGINEDKDNAVADARRKIRKRMKEISAGKYPVPLEFREADVILENLGGSNAYTSQEKVIRDLKRATKMISVCELARSIVDAGSHEAQEAKKAEIIAEHKPVSDAYKVAKARHKSHVKVVLEENAKLIEKVKKSFVDEVLKEPFEMNGTTWSDPELNFGIDRGEMMLRYKRDRKQIRINIQFSLYSKRIFPMQGQVNPRYIRTPDHSAKKVDGKFLVRQDYESKLKFDANEIPVWVQQFGFHKNEKVDLREFVTKAIDLNLLAKLKASRKDDIIK